MTPAKIKIGYAPTRRSIFSAPTAIEYRNLTADRLRELGVDFVDITDINKEGLLYDDNDLPAIVENSKPRRLTVSSSLTETSVPSTRSQDWPRK